jgi:hypothetical protein
LALEVSVLFEVFAVRKAVRFPESSQVDALEAARAGVLLVRIAGRQATVPVAIEVEIRHQIATPIGGTVCVRPAGISEFGDETLHSIGAVVSLDVAGLAVVSLIFVALPKAVAVGIQIAEFSHSTIQFSASTAVGHAGTILEVALLASKAVCVIQTACLAGELDGRAIFAKTALGGSDAFGGHTDPFPAGLSITALSVVHTVDGLAAATCAQKKQGKHNAKHHSPPQNVDGSPSPSK